METKHWVTLIIAVIIIVVVVIVVVIMMRRNKAEKVGSSDLTSNVLTNAEHDMVRFMTNKERGNFEVQPGAERNVGNPAISKQGPFLLKTGKSTASTYRQIVGRKV